MTKIREIELRGIRGVKNVLQLPIDGRSVLIYGDNASGKSSITDAIEWFFFDRVEHLSLEEIGRSGLSAIRNTDLSDADAGFVKLSMANSAYTASKFIEIDNDRVSTHFDNQSDDFKTYVDSSSRENLSLRHKDLMRFVTKTKNEKLRELSGIIGFSEVTKIRDTFRKSWGDLSKEIQSKDFQQQIARQQSQILEQLGQNITSDEEFVEAVNDLIKDFELDTKLSSIDDLDKILEKIRRPENKEAANQEAYLAGMANSIVNLPANVVQLDGLYSAYEKQYRSIASDIVKLRGLALGQLLRVGHQIIEQKQFTDPKCPLCLQGKNLAQLSDELEHRLAALEETRAESLKLRESKEDFKTQIHRARQIVSPHFLDNQSKVDENKARRKSLGSIIERLDKYEEALSANVLNGDGVPSPKTLVIDNELVTKLVAECDADLTTLRKAKQSDPKLDAYSKVKISRNGYNLVKELERESKVLEAQRDSMETVYRKFVQAQQNSLNKFLTTYSSRINEIYTKMIPGDEVENIRLDTIERDGELVGLRIVYDFRGEKGVSPPQKYLSESRLNCLGLSMFLTSVEAFNKANAFVILDDVISSYDADHRKRFGDVLVEQFPDYQFILLTHERAFFEIFKPRAKQKGWSIKALRYLDPSGTELVEAPKGLRERIEKKIVEKEKEGLGNDARIYLEGLLKDVAACLDVKVSYRTNDTNEERMAPELLTALKRKVNTAKCHELKGSHVFNQLLASTNIGNKDSHDHYASMEYPDLLAFWQDIMELEALFRCAECGSLLDLKYYDAVGKRIRCKKGELDYSWTN